MNRTVLTLLFAVYPTVCLFAQMGNMNAPTFAKDIAPILQKNCQSCHRPGEAAPFSMLTYEETRPWTGAMKLAVKQKLMPPWFADPQVGHFANDRSLFQREIDTIVAWVTADAPKGHPMDMPAPVHFVEGWGIPKPNVIFQLPKEFSVPESGMVEYQYVIVPTGFTEDKWVQAVEVRPTERSVVHHIIAYIREPGSNYFKDQSSAT
ncbi:MAG TPA: hypothetical protein VIX37_12600 [Candidatus Sulfotelmatobacter sp.]